MRSAVQRPWMQHRDAPCWSVVGCEEVHAAVTATSPTLHNRKRMVAAPVSQRQYDLHGARTSGRCSAGPHRQGLLTGSRLTRTVLASAATTGGIPWEEPQPSASPPSKLPSHFSSRRPISACPSPRRPSASLLSVATGSFTRDSRWNEREARHSFDQVYHSKSMSVDSPNGNPLLSRPRQRLRSMSSGCIYEKPSSSTEAWTPSY